MEFFIDPGEERDGAVVKTVAEGLGFGALDFVVAGAFSDEPLGTRYAGFFEMGVRN